MNQGSQCNQGSSDSQQTKGPIKVQWTVGFIQVFCLSRGRLRVVMLMKPAIKDFQTVPAFRCSHVPTNLGCTITVDWEVSFNKPTSPKDQTFCNMKSDRKMLGSVG